MEERSSEDATTSEPRVGRRQRVSSSSSVVFHTSLCGMFQNSQTTAKTDACALACCGIWLWERNRFLLTGEQPKPWKERPLEICMLLLAIAILVTWAVDPDNSILLGILAIFLLCGFLWRLFEFQFTRTVFRQQLAIEEYRRRERQKDTDDDDDGTFLLVGADHAPLAHPQSNPGLMQFLNNHQREVYGDGVHAMCGCAGSERNPLRDDDENGEEGHGGDFCSSMWSALAAMCCGWLCNCYCQLCGMCGIAQEHRYLTQVLPPKAADLWQRDYVTLQPWKEYYTAILRLRLSGQMRFLPHLKALSTLSHRLFAAAAIFVVLSALIVALPVQFPRWQILVLYGTLLQPLLILYFVYWFWNRLDISLDAVIKFFAAGFFICTGISIVYEMLASIVASVIEYLISLVGALGLILSGSIDIDDVLLEADDDEVAPSTAVPLAFSISIALVAAFLNSFMVAALVEEVGKYLTFWMTSEHPDLEQEVVLLPISLESNKQADSDAIAGETTKLCPEEQSIDSDISQLILAPTPSLETLGAATTVAMVTTALGFACAENLLYVFVYSPPGLNEEISTLMVRCLFPIHPLAAALQSIGVCRRDLETDSKSQLGRILLPAWLLHGSFDFFLMAYSLITRILRASSDNEENIAASPDGEEVEEDTNTYVVSIVMIIPLIGVLYYFKEAWAQRERLEKLDKEASRLEKLDKEAS